MTVALQLIVEDGSIVADANSYASVLMLQQFAVNRGVVLPSDVTLLSTYLLTAMDYIESKVDRWQGCTVTAAAFNQARYSGVDPATIPIQTLTWPRYQVMVDGCCLPYTTIPKRLTDAQCRLACDVANGLIPLPTTAGLLEGGLKEYKIGPLTRQWFNPSEILTSSLAPNFAATDALLAPLYKNFGGPLKLGRL